MFNLQGSEIIVILLLALVVLGPEKLPDAIRKFSQTYAELKKMGTGFQSEFKSAIDEPMREMRETADLVQKAADPKRVFEEAENEAHLRAEAEKQEAMPESEPVGVESNGTEPEPRTMKPVNQVAQSMARGPVENDVQTPAPTTSAEPVTASTPQVLQTPPKGAPAAASPPPPPSPPSPPPSPPSPPSSPPSPPPMPPSPPTVEAGPSTNGTDPT